MIQYPIMRNGSLPTKILKHLRDRNISLVKTADLTRQFGSPPKVSRALRRLVAEGELETLAHAHYRVLPNQPPRLAFNRAWSNPGAILCADTIIATTLARPSFRDVARLCRAYGVNKVRTVLSQLAEDRDIPARQAAEWAHRLDNIAAGFHHGALGLLADRNPAPH